VIAGYVVFSAGSHCPSNRFKCNVAAIGGPDRILIRGRIEGESGFSAAGLIVQPDVGRRVFPRNPIESHGVAIEDARTISEALNIGAP
jgi:hypothetical protein